MATIYIPIGDKRLGYVNEDESEFPPVDINGNSYEKPFVSRRFFQTPEGEPTPFVVLTANWKGGEIVLGEPPVATPAASDQPAVAEEKSDTPSVKAKK